MIFKKIDTIIFDLDGTLLNTIDDLFFSIDYMLKEYNLPIRSKAEVLSFVGNGVKKLVERSLPKNFNGDFGACFKTFTDHYDVHKNDNTAPYKGIIEMLKEVKAAGFKTAIVSNKYDAAVQELKANTFTGLIDVAIGEREGVRVKPYPDGVLLALNLLKANKENAVYVGDSDVDVATANASELPVVAVSWGFKTREFLAELNPNKIIDKPSELISAIKSL